MSNKGPRRPKAQSGPAQSRAAQEQVVASGAFADPAKLDMLEQFLKGTAEIPAVVAKADPNVAAVDAANYIPAAFQRLKKVDVVTKTKALTELCDLFAKSDDRATAGYVSAFVELFCDHVHIPDRQVRLLTFRALDLLLQKGKPVKAAAVPEMPRLVGPWLWGMHEMDFQVREAATASLNTNFPNEKKDVLLDRFYEPAVKSLLKILSDLKPLKDDVLDKNANLAFGCMGALGFLVRCVSKSREHIQQFVETAQFSKIAPGGGITARTPKVRSAVLGMMAEVAEHCQLTDRGHTLFSNVAMASVSENDAGIAIQFWRMLLVWLKHCSSDALRVLSPSFSGLVLSTMQNVNDEVLKLIFSSLLPYLSVISRDGARLEIIDVAVGTLIEEAKTRAERCLKMQTLARTDSTLAHCWNCLCEVWALLVQRKREQGNVSDAEEALNVIVRNIQEAVAKGVPDSAMQLMVAPLGQNLAKVLLRWPELAPPFLSVLIPSEDDQPSEPDFVSSEHAALVAVGVLKAMRAAGCIPSAPHFFGKLLLPKLVQCQLWDQIATVINFSQEVQLTILAEDQVASLLMDSALVAPAQHSELLSALLRTQHATIASTIVQHVLSFMSKRDSQCGKADRKFLFGILAQDAKLESDDVSSCLMIAANAQDIEALEFATATWGVPKTIENTLIKEIIDVIGALPIALEETQEEEEEDSDKNGNNTEETDEDIETQTLDTIPGPPSENRGKEFGRELSGWIQFLSSPKMVEIISQQQHIIQLVHTLLSQILQLAPAWNVNDFASMRFMGLCLKGQQLHVAEHPQLAVLTSKVHMLGMQSFVELVIELTEFVHLVKFDLRQLLSSVEDAFTAFVRGSELSVASLRSVAWSPAAVLSFFHESAPTTLYDYNLYDGLFFRIRLESRITKVDRTTLRQLRTHAGALPFVQLHLTLDSAAAAIGLGQALVTTAQHAAIALRAILVDQLLCFSQRIIGAISVKQAISEKASESLRQLALCCLKEILRRGVIDDFIDLLIQNPFDLVALATELKKMTDEEADFSLATIYQHIAERYFALSSPSAFVSEGVFLALSECEQTFSLSSQAEESLFRVLTTSFSKVPFALLLPLLRVALSVHQRLGSAVIGDEAAANVIAVAQASKESEMALAVLAELSRARLLNPKLYTELCHVLKYSISQSCVLHNLPTNGRLGQRSPNAPPLPLYVLRQNAFSLVAVYRGLALHKRQDDELHSSIFIYVFDVICECIYRLRDIKSESDMSEILEVVAPLTPFIALLRSHETKSLSASEASMQVVAQTLWVLHAWLASATVATIESLGVASIAKVISCVNQLASVSLVGSTKGYPADLNLVTRRCITRGIQRGEGETAKLAHFFSQLSRINRSTKQKLALFTHLMGWAAVISIATNTELEEEAAAALTPSVELKAQLAQLLDLITSLSLAPLERKASINLEHSHLCASHGEQLGFDVRILGAVPEDSDEMPQALAQGAISVLSLLLQSPFLGVIRQWLGTVDKGVAPKFVALVQGHISPVLTQSCLAGLLSHSRDGAMSFEIKDDVVLSVDLMEKSITVQYEVDENKLSVKLMLPEGFPLQPAFVANDLSSMKMKGVSSEKWRSWLMKMTVMLFSGSSSLWNCVELFAENMKKMFDGVDPCPICYAVISQTNNKMPDMACAVCHAKLHSSCLFKWWSNTNQSTCPMCRSPWYS